VTALNLTLESAHAALQRVLASREFVRAPAPSKLLRYIVEKGTSGRAGELKEYTIALEVFDRPSYDPQVDSFVRVEVGKLRKRLERYYSAEGRGDPLQIEIPKGSYVPSIRQVGEPEPPPRPRLAVRGMAAAAGLIALTAVAAWVSAKFDPVTGSSGTLVLAVLPFEDVSPAKEGKIFADGLTGELTTRLASIRGDAGDFPDDDFTV